MSGANNMGGALRVTSGAHPEHVGLRVHLLPSPRTYFAGQGLRWKGNGPWVSILCPFHADKRPSLRVDLDTGRFVCFACGTRGGSILTFHRKRYGLGVVEAARQLGAYVDDPVLRGVR